MTVVSFYEMADGALEKVMELYPEHRVWLDACHAAGKVIAAGPLGDPPEGALAIYPSREAAEEFINGDPFVINGLVKSWRIVERRAAFL